MIQEWSWLFMIFVAGDLFVFETAVWEEPVSQNEGTLKHLIKVESKRMQH